MWWGMVTHVGRLLQGLWDLVGGCGAWDVPPRARAREQSPLTQNPDNHLSGAVWANAPVVTDVYIDF